MVVKSLYHSRGTFLAKSVVVLPAYNPFGGQRLTQSTRVKAQAPNYDSKGADDDKTDPHWDTTVNANMAYLRDIVASLALNKNSKKPLKSPPTIKSLLVVMKEITFY